MQEVTQVDTKKQALLIAKKQLQNRGFNGFSFQDIADKLGIRKASLHYYFNSKDELALELIQSYEDAFQQWVQKKTTIKTNKCLESWLDLYNSMAQDKTKICPIGAFCVDLEGLSKTTRLKISHLFEVQRQWLIGNLKKGKKERLYRFKGKPEVMADMIFSSIQGGLQLSRLKKNPQFMVAISKQLIATLRS